MPVKATTARNVYTFIYPTTEWKEMKLSGMKAKDFKVSTDQFYIGVKRSKSL
jgi:hypothetical protein